MFRWKIVVLDKDTRVHVDIFLLLWLVYSVAYEEGSAGIVAEAPVFTQVTPQRNSLEKLHYNIENVNVGVGVVHDIPGEKGDGIQKDSIQR